MHQRTFNKILVQEEEQKDESKKKKRRKRSRILDIREIFRIRW